MKILVATDGSAFSRAAIENVAGFVPNAPDTEIKVISVYETLRPVTGDPFGATTQYYIEAENASRKIAEDAVTEALDLLRAKFPDMKFTVSTSVESGRAYRVIVELADDWKADMIVLGSHGSGFWERNFMGSVSDAVVHHAHCSVLIVRTPAE